MSGALLQNHLRDFAETSYTDIERKCSVQEQYFSLAYCFNYSLYLIFLFGA